MLLNETVPQWVIDITVDVSTLPDFTSTSVETTELIFKETP